MNLLPISLLLYIALHWCAVTVVIAQAPDEPVERAAETERRSETRRRSQRGSMGDLVVLANDVTIREGESARDVVVIGGTATIHGRVTGELVVICGQVRLGPEAEVRRDLTIVGGSLEADPEAKINGHRVVIGANPAFPGNLAFGKWPSQWFNTGLLQARPFPHQYQWSWAVAGIAFLLYLVIAVLFPRQIQASVAAIEQKPASVFATGLLSFMLIGPALLMLILTVIGIIVVPFAIVAFVVAFFFGKVAVYRYAGQQLGSQLGWSLLQKPLVALAVGVLLFCLIYAVPVIGFLAWGLVASLGVGAVLVAVFSRSPSKTSPATAPPAYMDPIPAPVSEGAPAVLLPRVGFWWRFLATLLDAALVAVVMAAVFHQPKWFLVAWVAYHLTLWSWKGTTLGGIICGLKIVRTDGRPIDFGVALVRLLGGFFSAAVLWLGFFWAGWSQEKQAWHDKIAGTVIVRYPRNIPLL